MSDTPISQGDTITTSGTSTPSPQTQTQATQTHTQQQQSAPATDSENKTDQEQQQTAAHHVIFVVHGMGRQLEVPFGNYEKNVSHLVECTRTVLQSQFHELETNVHIIPIEWHAKLHSMVDERMALTSLRTVPKVRMVMNDYMADILYYFNPHFGTQIVRMIVDELNEAYDLFMEKRPDFNGKISIYALSLGGVAMFDILTCQDDDEPEESGSSFTATATATGSTSQAGVKAEEAKEEEDDGVQEPPTKKARVRKQDQSKFRAVIPKLKFRPEYLFTVGSPVGAVMVMRNLDWETFHPPDDIIHHNLFHPFDPLGYRLEPLIDPVFAGVPATVIGSYQSQLFPSLLSLPSLPSLQLPESISAFWENRVPTLPRPSIPTLSSISLMTQSLKAGRWLPGSGSITDARAEEEDEASNSTLDSDSDVDGDDQDAGVNVSSIAAGGDTDRIVSSPATSVSDADEAQKVKSARSETRNNNWEPESMMMMDGGDASVSEFMGAATAATYLDLQTEEPSSSGARTNGQAHVAAIKAQNDTTTESPQKGGRQPPARRPSLGPRRISSRVEEDEISADAAAGSKRSMMDVAEESYLSAENGGSSVSAREKALGAGAKSDVIQESIIRSMPEGSSPRTSSASADDDTKADTEETDNATTNATKKKAVHVEGRATKLPYRIDHVLQETTVDQYTNEYLLGMRSHFKYWANKDVAYHILRTLLDPVEPETENKVLDLKLSMPVPVSTTNGAKEAAEAKAKAASMAAAAGSSTTRARSGTLGSIASDAEVKKQNRMSFSFSFFGGGGGQSSTNSSSDDLSIQQQLSEEQERLRKRRQRREEEEEEREQHEQGQEDEDFEMMDEEGELFGYRYSDLDMAASRASVGWTKRAGSGSKSLATTKVSRTSAKTLFQSSPWSSSKKQQGAGGEVEVVESSYTRTMSTTSLTTTKSSGSGNKRRISVERRSSTTVAVASTTASTDSTSSSSEEEGVEVSVEDVEIPDLARPAKLHHRATRVEE